MRHWKTSSLALAALAALAAGNPIEVRADNQTDTPCTPTVSRSSHLVGNGNPHQNFIFKQVTDVTDCTNNPGGGASVDKTTEVSWGMHGDLSYEFTSGGFDVSTSVSTGYTQSFGCTGKGGKTLTGDLCVFQRIQTTAYTVDQTTCHESPCTGQQCSTSSNGVMFAPNSGDNECFYSNKQLGIACKGFGAETHINYGPAGGPHFVSCEPAIQG